MIPMNYRSVNLLKKCLIVIIFISIFALVGNTQTAHVKPGLTVDNVIALTQAGVTDETIIMMVRKSETPFKIGTDDMLRLKKAKVSDIVIRAMMNPKAESGADIVIANPAARTQSDYQKVNDVHLISSARFGISLVSKNDSGGDTLIPLAREDTWGDKDKDGLFLRNSDCDNKSNLSVFGSVIKNKGGSTTCHYFWNLRHPSAAIQTTSSNPVFIILLSNTEDIRDFGLDTCTVQDGNRKALIQTVKGASLKESLTLHKSKDGTGIETGGGTKKVVMNSIDPLNQENLQITLIKPYLYRVEMKKPLDPGEYAFQQIEPGMSAFYGFSVQ